MMLTGPHPWLYLCLIWLGRFVRHLNHEFPVWGWISMAEAFKYTSGELSVLGSFCPACPVNGPCCRGTFHCNVFSLCARRHLVFLITHSTPYFPVDNYLWCWGILLWLTVVKKQSTEAIGSWEKGTERKERLGCAGDASLQPVVPILHCSKGISQPAEQYPRAAGYLESESEIIL